MSVTLNTSQSKKQLQLKLVLLYQDLESQNSQHKRKETMQYIAYLPPENIEPFPVPNVDRATKIGMSQATDGITRFAHVCVYNMN